MTHERTELDLNSFEMPSEITHVSLDAIDVDGDWKADTRMMVSMAFIGQMQPVVLVRKSPGADKPYILADGRRRYAAAVEIGRQTIKAVVCEDVEEADKVVAALTLAGNLHDRNELSEARALDTLGDEDVARQVAGLSKGQQRALRVLNNLLPEYQEQAERGALSLSAAKKLARLDHDQQRRAYEHALGLMEEHNELRRRADRKVPTAGEIDAGVRRVRAELQPSMPIPDMGPTATPPGEPPHDPVRMVQALQRMGRYYLKQQPELGTVLLGAAEQLMNA